MWKKVVFKYWLSLIYQLQVYLEQKNEWNQHVWSPSWYALLGAYDIELGDTLNLYVQEPVGGVMNITDNSTSLPTIANPCPNVTERTVSLFQ